MRLEQGSARAHLRSHFQCAIVSPAISMTYGGHMAGCYGTPLRSAGGPASLAKRGRDPHGRPPWRQGLGPTVARVTKKLDAIVELLEQTTSLDVVGEYLRAKDAFSSAGSWKALKES